MGRERWTGQRGCVISAEGGRTNASAKSAKARRSVSRSIRDDALDSASLRRQVRLSPPEASAESAVLAIFSLLENPRNATP